jgi:hypothetical protein
MIPKSLPWTFGTGSVTLVGGLVLAVIGPATPYAAPDRQDETCTNSSDSIQHLATIDTARDGSFQCLGLSLAGNAVKAIRVETHTLARTGWRPQAEQVTIAEFSVAVIESSHGAVLDGVPGHDAIILQGHFSTPPDTADLVTSYLYNGFTGEYRSCHISLARVPDDGWRLLDRFGQPISHIVVRTRQMPLIGMFGIANLDGACL